MKRPNNPESWDKEEVVRRVNKARAAHQLLHDEEIKWADIGRELRWKSSTTSDVSNAYRALRIEEVARIAAKLNVSPGWLAFGEGRMWREQAGIEPGVDSYSIGENAAAATEREIAAAEAAREQEKLGANRPRAVGEGRSGPANAARGRSSGDEPRGKPRKGRSRT